MDTRLAAIRNNQKNLEAVYKFVQQDSIFIPVNQLYGESLIVFPFEVIDKVIEELGIPSNLVEFKDIQGITYLITPSYSLLGYFERYFDDYTEFKEGMGEVFNLLSIVTDSHINVSHAKGYDSGRLSLTENPKEINISLAIAGNGGWSERYNRTVAWGSQLESHQRDRYYSDTHSPFEKFNLPGDPCHYPFFEYNNNNLFVCYNPTKWRENDHYLMCCIFFEFLKLTRGVEVGEWKKMQDDLKRQILIDKFTMIPKARMEDVKRDIKRTTITINNYRDSLTEGMRELEEFKLKKKSYEIINGELNPEEEANRTIRECEGLTDIASVDILFDRLIFTTNSISCRNRNNKLWYPLGIFIISVFDSGAIRFNRIGGRFKEEGDYTEGYFGHPHIYEDHSACLGNINIPIVEYIAKFDYINSITLLTKWLKTATHLQTLEECWYNEEQLQKWEKENNINPLEEYTWPKDHPSTPTLSA